MGFAERPEYGRLKFMLCLPLLQKNESPIKNVRLGINDIRNRPTESNCDDHDYSIGSDPRPNEVYELDTRPSIIN